MWHVDPGDPRSPRLAPGEILGRVGDQVPAALASLGSRLESAEPSVPHIALALLFVLGLAVACVRRREPAELYALGSLVLIAVYFGFARRLLLPVFALALPATVELLRDGTAVLLRRVRRDVTGTGAARVPSGIAGVALALLLIVDLPPRRGWETIEARHRAFGALCSELATELPPDARPASALGWYYSVYMERPVWSVAFALRRDGRPEALEALLDRHAIDTLLLCPAIPEDRLLLPYVQQRYGGAMRRVGDGFLVRVRP
jgi:hypothetical protein